MNKYSVIFIIVAVLLGGVVVWQQQKINTLDEQIALAKLTADKPGNGSTVPPVIEETKPVTTPEPTPPTPDIAVPPVEPPTTTMLTTPVTIGSTLPVSEAKEKMDAATLATLSSSEEIVGDVMAVDSTNVNIFYFATHGKDATGKETSHIYKYNGDSKKMADWYWERTTERFWIVGTAGTQVLWIKVSSEPTPDPCWQKWLQPIEALDVKTPTAGTTSFATPTDIFEQATKDQKVCTMVNP